MRICDICNSCDETISLSNIEICIPEKINLNSNLNVKKCKNCYFYFSDNNNNQKDYNNYYINCSNYINNDNNICDKDVKCYNFLCDKIDYNSKILDYGSGNGILAKKLKEKFVNVETYDIGIEIDDSKHDFIILSHVLEHIFDINSFINNVEKSLNNVEGTIYIEVPNAEYYDKFKDICPLQEINIEHINFFTKYSLNKLMLKHNYVCKILIDDYFTTNNFKYYVIRGLFTKTHNNFSFENYLSDGLLKINNINYMEINNLDSIYIYGCGQFLFKILHKIKTKIINVVDDSNIYYNTDINSITIINFEDLKNKVNDNDNIVIVTALHSNVIKEKLLAIDKKLNIFTLN